MAKFKRVLLKLSGESLMGNQEYGIDSQRLNDYASQIKEIVEKGVQVAIVIGGGNIFRGLSGSTQGFDRVKGDQMGMLATVINSLALGSALKNAGVANRVLTAIRMEPVGEFYSKDKAIDSLESGEVVILSGGTGNPYFTTDTGATLRATEIGACMLIKATKVDGVYDKDPMKYSDAVKYDTLSYDKALEDHIKVMDDTAIALAKDNKLPIVVANMNEKGNLLAIIQGDYSKCSIVK